MLMQAPGEVAVAQRGISTERGEPCRCEFAVVAAAAAAAGMVMEPATNVGSGGEPADAGGGKAMHNAGDGTGASAGRDAECRRRWRRSSSAPSGPAMPINADGVAVSGEGAGIPSVDAGALWPWPRSGEGAATWAAAAASAPAGSGGSLEARVCDTDGGTMISPRSGGGLSRGSQAPPPAASSRCSRNMEALSKNQSGRASLWPPGSLISSQSSEPHDSLMHFAWWGGITVSSSAAAISAADVAWRAPSTGTRSSTSKPARAKTSFWSSCKAHLTTNAGKLMGPLLAKSWARSKKLVNGESRTQAAKPWSPPAYNAAVAAPIDRPHNPTALATPFSRRYSITTRRSCCSKWPSDT
mmetsp:Transcript_52226/g.152057  ORF Transcript_52226/g.152057 Transcript_52226/m.152057 type:complete len:355 (+) Transcript_52226:494-1558(+)